MIRLHKFYADRNKREEQHFVGWKNHFAYLVIVDKVVPGVVCLEIVSTFCGKCDYL